MDLRFSIFWCMTSQLIVVVYHTHWETYSFAVLSASMCTKVIGRSRGLTKGSRIVLRHGHTIVFGLFYICCIFLFAYLCKGSSEILYTCHCIHLPLRDDLLVRDSTRLTVYKPKTMPTGHVRRHILCFLPWFKDSTNSNIRSFVVSIISPLCPSRTKR